MWAEHPEAQAVRDFVWPDVQYTYVLLRTQEDDISHDEQLYLKREY